MNTMYTHLEIKHNKDKWVFTGSYGSCTFCKTNELSAIICYGYYDKDNHEKFVYACEKHLIDISCKKQLCNYCNKKAIIRDQPKICTDCSHLILTNCIDMIDVCQFPIIERSKCGCKFCLQY